MAEIEVDSLIYRVVPQEKEPEEEKGFSRREFLKDAALLVGGATLGTMAFATACKSSSTKTNSTTPSSIPSTKPTTTPTFSPTTTPSPVPIAVPATSACAITSPPPSMEGINTHTELYGTGADPDIITLGPKVGANPDWPTYANKLGMEFELKNWTPVLAPLDMILIGVNNRGAVYRIQNGVKQSPFNDLGLFFESNSPDWPKMIVFIYHLFSSPLVLKDSQNEVEEWGTVLRAQGHLFYPDSDYMAPEDAISCDAMIGRSVKRGELIAFAGSVGTHAMAPFCFKVSHTSVNPTVKKGNPYLHWVQPSSFFYWKSYSPDADFPSGVLAYPFECDGYQLPAEQHDVNYKYTSKK